VTCRLLAAGIDTKFWKDAFLKGRVIVPADAIFEWKESVRSRIACQLIAESESSSQSMASMTLDYRFQPPPIGCASHTGSRTVGLTRNKMV
jgi:hypothetical protein